jgi:flagellar M-ring protein FliF
MTDFLDGLRALGPARLAAMAAVALGVLAVLSLRAGSERYALLYGDLDLRESGQMVDALGRAHIPYQLGSDGATIRVPSGDVARARVLLAGSGLPSGGSVGYEIFDHSDGLAASSFQERINQTRALEGELARTIRGISGVRGARVHLVLPTREPFARDQQAAQASVMLTLAGAGGLDREGVQAVLTLVAAAVPGLRPDHVTIIDSRGDVLARAGEPGGGDGAGGGIGPATHAEDLRRTAEMRLSRQIETLLERTFGVGHVRAEATVDLNLDRVSQTDEKYDPDGQVPRSEQSTTDNTRSIDAPATVSVQNNLPNANAAAPSGAGSQEQRSETTTNYEIGKTVRTMVRDQAETKRISLAVMIDGTTDPAPGAKATGATGARRPLTEAEIAQVTSLVKSAIGFDDKRGDHVDVVSMRFADADAVEAPSVPHLFGLPIERADLAHLAETLVIGLVAVLALMTVVRPMIARLTLAPDAVAEIGGEGAGAVRALAAGGETITIGDQRPIGNAVAMIQDGTSNIATPALPAPTASVPLMIEDERLVTLANIDGKVRASLLRRATELVDRHPEESLAILRGWMAQEVG